MRRFCYLLLLLLTLGACKSSFTDEEKKIIGDGEGIMRLWTVENPREAAFLRQQARPLKGTDGVSSDFQKLKARMLATVTDTANPGVGIAAPQVGIGCRLIAVQRFDKKNEPFEFYLNPEIIYYSDTKACGPEGCLSIPNVTDSVWRSDKIVIRYRKDPYYCKTKEVSPGRISTSVKVEQNLLPETDTVCGFTAVIFQHEIDHLNGILFTDRVKEKNNP